MYALRYKDVILTPHVLDYSVTIGLLAVLLGLLWKYWTVTQPYADFPTGHVVLKLFAALFRKYPNRIPISAAFFQTYVSICERFQKEGICVIWCFRPLVIVTGEEPSKIFSNESAALDKSYHYESLQDAFGTGLVTSVTIGLLVALLGLLWKYWTVTQPYANFPTGHFVLKLFAAFFRKGRERIPISVDIFQTFVSICQRYQKDGICVIWCFRPMVFVFGEKSAKLFSNESAVLDKSYHYEVLQDGFGTGLVTSNGKTWKKHRKMLTPVFHVGMLKSKMAIMNENCEILVKELSESMNETFINVLKYIKPCTMSILLQFVLGLKLDDTENKMIISRTIQIIENLSPITALRICIPLLHWKFMLNFIPSGRQCIKMYDEANDLVKKLIEEMRKTVMSRTLAGDDREIQESEEQVNKSFAHILLDLHLKDPSFTMYDLESEVGTFIAAGYDTVAHAMMWTLYLLGLDPAVQDRVYDELEFIGGGPVQYEDAQQLKYMECVIKESLRLFPPVPIHGRCTTKDIQCGKYEVPSGSDIVFFPYMLHRNPDIYPDPEKFDPERFAGGNFKKPWMHTPFSEGIRNCIGKKFAMLELKVMLAHVLRNFRITSLDRREDLVLCWDTVLNPWKPLRIKLSHRMTSRTRMYAMG